MPIFDIIPVVLRGGVIYMPPYCETGPGRFYTPTPEEEAARREADLRNAQLLGESLGDTGDDFVILKGDDGVESNVMKGEQRELVEEGAVPF